jgi:hypothetical protein
MGTLALDIDGTLTDSTHTIPHAVIEKLTELNEAGWEIMLVTGRSYRFASETLFHFPFPYILLVQNGADAIEMPSRAAISHAYLPKSTLLAIDPLLPLIVYTGPAYGDQCYYIEDRFDAIALAYLKKLQEKATLSLTPIPSFEQLEQKAFPLIKGIADRATLSRAQEELCHLQIEQSHIQDPFFPDRSFLLITAQGVDKGRRVIGVMKDRGLSRPIVAAGNDLNDLPLLQIADRAIAMEGSPQQLLDVADTIAPPSSEMGILAALSSL